jgi:L-lactate utilization protein LutB
MSTCCLSACLPACPGLPQVLRPKTIVVRQGDLAETILLVRSGQCCELVAPALLPQVGRWAGRGGH